jgi:hypothetical protein
VFLVFGWRKAAGSTISRMPMDKCGRELVGTYKFITYNQIELRDSALLKKGRVTYAAEQWVTVHKTL